LSPSSTPNFAYRFAQVPPQRVEIEVDAVLGEFAEDLVMRRRNSKLPISVKIRTAERRQDREIRFGHANTRARASSGL